METDSQSGRRSCRACRMKARLCALAVYFCVAFVSAPIATRAAPVPSSQETDFQSWDELDLLARLSSYLDVTWIGRGRFSTDLPNPAVYIFGTDWNFSASKYLEITPSFYYFAARTASGASVKGESPILAFTPRFSRGRLTLVDRNRFCGRFGNHGIGPSFVYRNRPRIDYRIGPEKWEASLFGWDEVYYFTSTGAWTRNRIVGGGHKAFTERIAGDLYYQRENNSNSKPAHINTIAVLLELRIR